MKFLIILLLFLSSYSYSQEQQNETALNLKEKKIIGLSLGLNQGSFLFAPNTKIDVEFNNMNLSYLKIRESNIVSDLSFDYMFNQSKVKFYSIQGKIGYNFNLKENLNIVPHFNLGISLYKENSQSQNIQAFGNLIGAGSQIIYNIKDDFGLKFGLNYSRLMFTRGYSPKDPSEEMVYQYMTYSVGLFWEL